MTDSHVSNSFVRYGSAFYCANKTNPEMIQGHLLEQRAGLKDLQNPFQQYSDADVYIVLITVVSPNE